jgi:hypothetical protein
LAKNLAGHDLLVEESLSLLNTSGEALVLGLLNLGSDGVSLALGRGCGLLLLSTRLLALVSSQVAAELGLGAALVVEVDGVSYSQGAGHGQQWMARERQWLAEQHIVEGELTDNGSSNCCDGRRHHGVCLDHFGGLIGLGGEGRREKGGIRLR